MNTNAKSDEQSPPSTELFIGNTRWQVDSGATRHCTPEKSVFTISYIPCITHQTLQVANGVGPKIMGKGDVHFRTRQGVDLVLKDVWHVPGIDNSYISVAVLDADGYTNLFDHGMYKLTKGSVLVAEAEKINKKYFVEGTLVPSSGDVRLSELWHKRLGHLNLYGVENLGIQGPTVHRCSYCPFRGLNEPVCKKPDLLELVHMDLQGPFQKPSLNGSLYFVTFIDDSSRKICCYLMKSETQILNALREFKFYAEKQTGKKLKCIFSNRGKESNPAFYRYCTKHGINYLSMSPGVASLNNLAESANKSLMEKVFAVLAHSKLPWSYWDFALSATVYVLNLCPAGRSEIAVPDEVWFDKKVSRDHLRVFGCRALVRSGKLKDVGMERDCVFVGYAEEGTCYKFYDPFKMEVIYGSDAKFFEDQSILEINSEQRDEGSTASERSRGSKGRILEYLWNIIRVRR